MVHTYCIFRQIRLRGATVARLTPDQKVACSNPVGVTNFLNLFFMYFYLFVKCGFLLLLLSCFSSFFKFKSYFKLRQNKTGKQNVYFFSSFHRLISWEW